MRYFLLALPVAPSQRKGVVPLHCLAVVSAAECQLVLCTRPKASEGGRGKMECPVIYLAILHSLDVGFRTSARAGKTSAWDVWGGGKAG